MKWETPFDWNNQFFGGKIMSEKQTSSELAEYWYSYEEVKDYVKNSHWRGKIPTDIRKPDFSRWLTGELRKAMKEGIELGRKNKEEK
jgi:hypothetical protein